MQLLKRDYLSTKWADILCPDEGISGEIVVAYGRLLSAYGETTGVIAFDLDSRSCCAMMKVKDQWNVALSFGMEYRDAKEAVLSAIRELGM